ncbi:MAG: hypothetical protein ACYC3X_16280 [Pirellulaceae bacterium]
MDVTRAWSCVLILTLLGGLMADVAAADEPILPPPAVPSHDTDSPADAHDLRVAAARDLEPLGHAVPPQQVPRYPGGPDKRKLLAEKLVQFESLQKEIAQLKSELNDSRQILLKVQLIECVLDEQHPTVDKLLEEIRGAAATTGPAPQFCVLGPEQQDAANRVLRQLREGGRIKMLAEPTIVTRNGRAAHLNCGGEIPIPAANPEDKQPPQLVKCGTLLDALPVLQPDGTIRLDINLSVREVDTKKVLQIGGRTVPAVRSHSVNTAVEMQSGQMLVQAGLMQPSGSPATHPPTDQPDASGQPATALLVTIFAEVVQPPLQAAKTTPRR